VAAVQAALCLLDDADRQSLRAAIPGLEHAAVTLEAQSEQP
jgi:hypothetical protein